MTEPNKLEAVINKQNKFVCHFRPDGILTSVNQVYCDYLGKAPDELIGQNFKKFIPAETCQSLDQFLSSFTPAHFIETVEYPVFLPDGRLRWQKWAEYAIFDNTGILIEFRSIGEDITELKETEIKLQEQEKCFKQLVELSPMAISVHDGDKIRHVQVLSRDQIVETQSWDALSASDKMSYDM